MRVRVLALLLVSTSSCGTDVAALDDDAGEAARDAGPSSEDASADAGRSADAADDGGLDPRGPGGVFDLEGYPSGGITQTEVEVDGRRLLVNGEPYEIRGVCWSPVPRGQSVPVDWSSELAAEDVPLMWAAGINTVRNYSPILDEGLLDALAAAGIRVIQDVYSLGSRDPSTALQIVEAQRDHPAILMWALGNEWNYNGLYVGIDAGEVERRLEALAAEIEAIDPDHPIATSHGELPSEARLRAMPSIDVWGLNVYRGDQFFGLIEDWAERSNKPMFLAEFGADAYDSRIDAPNLRAQADATRRLTAEIVEKSVARSSAGVVLGGTIFAWSDEWWKDASGSVDVHDTGGIAPGGGPPPDRTFNEEWWGLVDIDRNPRPALLEYRDAY